LPCRNVGGALSWDSHKWFSFPSSFPPPPFLLAIFSLALTRKKKFKNYGCSGEGKPPLTTLENRDFNVFEQYQILPDADPAY
jgi:hypothetical protein